MDGRVRELLRTQNSNIPDAVPEEEQGKNVVITHRLPDLTLLSDAQLYDQLGDGAFKIDPVRNTINPFATMCFKRSALLGASSAGIFGISYYLRKKQAAKASLAGALAGAVAFSLGWWHCRGEVRKRKELDRNQMHTPLPAGIIKALPRELEAARIEAEKEGKTLELPIVANIAKVRDQDQNTTQK